MNKLVALSFALALLAPAVAVGQDVPVDRTSADERATAFGYVTLSGGVTSQFTFGGRVTGGLYLAPRLSVEASLDADSGSFRGSNAVAVGGRFCVTDHINVGGGLAWRAWEEGILLDSISHERRGQEISLELTLGTQWQFGRASLGVDWAGASVPLVDLGGSQRTRNGLETLHERQLDEAGARLALRVLFLKAGLAF